MSWRFGINFLLSSLPGYSRTLIRVFNYFILLINNTVTDIYYNIFFKFKEGVISSDKFNYFDNTRISLERVIIIVSNNIIDYLL